MYLKRIVQLLFVFFLFITGVSAQNDLPLSPKVITGKLENGLTYYILPNKKPEKKVELRLVVRAGSINEDEDQQGLAHMCEHMAFNGTTHFKKNEIVSFLQDIGVGFGNDLNAYTSFDQTVYILPIPTDKAGNLEKGFQVLEDWAHNVTYNDQDIDDERNVILEESRLGKGAMDRMYKQLYPKLLAGSKYAKRLPIGIDSIIKNFKYDAIKRFYREWYRPELMSVIVVGDITAENAEAFVKKHFAGIKAQTSSKERTYDKINPFATSEAIVLKDKEATNYTVRVQYSNMSKEVPSNSVKGYRHSLVQSLYASIFNQRLQELTQQPNPPFVYGGSNFYSYAIEHESFSVSAVAANDNQSTALKAVVTEIERAKRYGFTAAELERAKKSYLSSLEKMYNNRDKTESVDLADELVRYVSDFEPVPGIEKEFELTKELLPQITLNDINGALGFMDAYPNKVVAYLGPDKEGAVAAEPSQILSLFDEVAKADIKPYEEKVIAQSLLSNEPKGGKVLAKKVNAALGTTEYTLSNGVKVILKKTDYKDDEIVMNASRLGGYGQYGAEDKSNYTFMTQVIASMGFGNFSPVDLKKNLAGKNATVGASFSDTKETFSGNSSVKDFETLLQLLYLRVTAPRVDTALFHSFVQKQKAQYAMLGSNPEWYFIDSFYSVLYNKNPLAPINVPKVADYDKINLDRVVSIYKSHFGDMSNMKFVFVGSVNEKVMLPLIEKYIGSLPATGKKFTVVDNKLRTSKGKSDFTVYKGIEEKSFVIVSFAGEMPYNEDLSQKADALNEILNIRIIEELREKIQGIYGGGIYGGFDKYPFGAYQYIAQLPCGPEKADTLVKALFHEIAKIKKNGIDQSYLNKVKLQWIEAHKVSYKTNETWASELIDYLVEAKDINRFTKYESFVNKITVADIKQAAGLFLNDKNLIIAKLMPEKYKP